MLSRVSAYASRHFSKAHYAAAQWHHVHTRGNLHPRVYGGRSGARMYTYTHIYTHICTCALPVCWLWNRTQQNRAEQNRTEQNRTERNGAERNRMKRNRSERSREAQADCTAAACLLAHLGVLNLYVVSSTGSAISLSHWRGGRRRENQHNHGRGERDEKKEGTSRYSRR